MMTCAKSVLNLSSHILSKTWIHRTPLMIPGEMSVSEAVRMLDQQHKEYAVVVQTTDFVQCLGIFSSQELIKAIAQGVELETTTVQTVVSPVTHTLLETEIPDLTRILRDLQEYALNYLPIVDVQGNWVGVISRQSCLEGYSLQEDHPPLPVLSNVTRHPALTAIQSRGDSPLVPSFLTDHFSELISQQAFQKFWEQPLVQKSLKDPRFLQVALTQKILTEQLNQQLTQQIQDCKIRLKNGEAQFQQLVENIDSIFWITNPERTEILYQSPAYEQIFGSPLHPESLSPCMWYPSIHPEDRDRVMEVHRSKYGEKYQQDFRIIQPDGTLRWIRDRAFPIRNSQGDIDCLVGIADDITLYKQTEEALKQSLHTLSDLKYALDQIACIATLDPQGHILNVNDKLSELAQISPEQLLKTPYPQLCPESLTAEFWQEIWLTLTHNFLWQGEIEHQTSSQAHYWLNVTFIPFCDEAGILQHSLMIGFEISKRKRAEAEMLKTLIREKDLGELKANFITITSHEFRTPLSIIKCSAELLSSYPLSPEQQKEELQAIQESVQYLTALLDNLLILSRGESQELHGKWEPINISLLCQYLVQKLQGQYPDYSLQFQDYSPHPTLPFLTDTTLLQQILTNLLTNAIKYSSPGQPIVLRMCQDHRRLSLEVRDRGIGIPTEAQEHLWTAFYRASNVGSTPGTGLGLAIVKTYVEVLQGTIQVESQVGEGTAITLQLPQLSRGREE